MIQTSRVDGIPSVIQACGPANEKTWLPSLIQTHGTVWWAWIKLTIHMGAKCHLLNVDFEWVLWINKLLVHSTLKGICHFTVELYSDLSNIHHCFLLNFCAGVKVPWCCWLGSRKSIRPVKSWVVGCWCGYVSVPRCRFAYGPADATPTHYFLLQLIQVGFSFMVLPFWCQLPRVVPDKIQECHKTVVCVCMCMCVCVCVCERNDAPSIRNLVADE